MRDEIDKEIVTCGQITHDGLNVGGPEVAGYYLANQATLMAKYHKLQKEADGYEYLSKKYADKIRARADKWKETAKKIKKYMITLYELSDGNIEYVEGVERLFIDPDYALKCLMRAIKNFKMAHDPGYGFAIGGTSKLLWRPGKKAHPAELSHFRRIMSIVKKYTEQGIIRLTSTPVLTNHESYFDLLKIMHEYVPRIIKVSSTYEMSEDEKQQYSGGVVFPERKYLHDSCCNFNSMKPLSFEADCLVSFLESAIAGNHLRLTGMSFYGYCGVHPQALATNIMAEYFGALSLAITLNPNAVCVNGAMPAVLNSDGTTDLDASNAMNAFIQRISREIGVQTIQSGSYNNETSFVGEAKKRALEASARGRRFFKNVDNEILIRFGFGHLTTNYMCKYKLILDCEHELESENRNGKERKPLYFPTTNNTLEIITRVQSGSYLNDPMDSNLRDASIMNNWIEKLKGLGYYN